MKKIVLITLFIAFLFSQKIFACECAINPPFLTAIKNEKTKIIAKVKIRRYLTYSDHPHGNTYVTSMEAEIEEIYRGKEERTKITIRGSSGWECLEYLSQFTINESYIIAVSEAGNSEYALSNCGEFWLSIKNGIAHGRIAEGKESISLDELKKKLPGNSTQNNFSISYKFNFPNVFGNYSFTKLNKINKL